MDRGAVGAAQAAPITALVGPPSEIGGEETTVSGSIGPGRASRFTSGQRRR